MKWLKTKWYTVLFKRYLKLRKKKKHFDRESKTPKQKRIKSKPIQQKNSIKSNISYLNLKNGGKKKHNVQCPIDALFTILPLSLCSNLSFFFVFFKWLVSFYTKRAPKQCFNIVKHYNLLLLNGVVVLPNNVIYRFLT